MLVKLLWTESITDIIKGFSIIGDLTKLYYNKNYFSFTLFVSNLLYRTSNEKLTILRFATYRILGFLLCKTTFFGRHSLVWYWSLEIVLFFSLLHANFGWIRKRKRYYRNSTKQITWYRNKIKYSDDLGGSVWQWHGVFPDVSIRYNALNRRTCVLLDHHYFILHFSKNFSVRFHVFTDK